MGWDVRLLAEVEQWLLDLEDDSYDQVAAAIDKLESDGPTLGRPLVDRVEGSRHHNMKELRPGSVGRSEIRVLGGMTNGYAATAAHDSGGEFAGSKDVASGTDCTPASRGPG